MNMNTRNILLIVLALVIAGITAFMVRSMLSSGKKTAESAAPTATTIEVAVAQTDLPAGYILKAGDLRWQQWPDEKVAKEYVVKGKNGTLESFQTSIIRRGFSAGEPVTWGRVIKQGDHGYMAAMLTPGLRAVSVKVNALTGVSGFVFPGDRVDLILSHEINRKSDTGDNTTKNVTETVLTNIRVLAIDQKTEDQEGKPKVSKTVTLEVTPKQAEEVALAENIGRLSLSLRSLARTDAELHEMAAKGFKYAAETNQPPSQGESYTWDSEVSKVIEKAGGVQNQVSIVRGDKSQTQQFR